MARGKPDRTRPPEPWYAEGLRFECTRCGRCCAGEPGYVWLEKEEISAIARFLNLPDAQLLQRYCRRVLFRVSLLERPNGDCVFLSASGCGIYPVRPTQCRTFPFWSHVLASPDRWSAFRTKCPGVGQGRLYTCPQIQAIRDGRRQT